MRHLLIAVALACASATPAFAHPDHDEFVVDDPRGVAIESATDVKGRLIERGAIPASWGAIEANGATVRQRGGANEWVVTFRNDAVADPSQRVLYVMLSYSGVYIAANFTGE